jgi:hypothetical protein
VGGAVVVAGGATGGAASAVRPKLKLCCGATGALCHAPEKVPAEAASGLAPAPPRTAAACLWGEAGLRGDAGLRGEEAERPRGLLFAAPSVASVPSVKSMTSGGVRLAGVPCEPSEGVANASELSVSPEEGVHDDGFGGSASRGRWGGEGGADRSSASAEMDMGTAAWSSDAREAVGVDSAHAGVGGTGGGGGATDIGTERNVGGGVEAASGLPCCPASGATWASCCPGIRASIARCVSLRVAMKASAVTELTLAKSAGSAPCAPPIGLRLLRPGRRFVGVSPLPMWNETFSLAKAPPHPSEPGSTCMPRPPRGGTSCESRCSVSTARRETFEGARGYFGSSAEKKRGKGGGSGSRTTKRSCHPASGSDRTTQIHNTRKEATHTHITIAQTPHTKRHS